MATQQFMWLKCHIIYVSENGKLGQTFFIDLLKHQINPD